MNSYLSFKLVWVWRLNHLRVFTEGGMFRAASTGTCILRNWLRSPCSLYSMTTHRGCSMEHTPSTLAMFWSSSPAKILTSFCNSALWKKNHVKSPTIMNVNILNLLFFLWQRGWEEFHGYQPFAHSHLRVVFIETVRFGHVNLKYFNGQSNVWHVVSFIIYIWHFQKIKK